MASLYGGWLSICSIVAVPVALIMDYVQIRHARELLGPGAKRSAATAHSKATSAPTGSLEYEVPRLGAVAVPDFDHVVDSGLAGTNGRALSHNFPHMRSDDPEAPAGTGPWAGTGQSALYFNAGLVLLPGKVHQDALGSVMRDLAEIVVGQVGGAFGAESLFEGLAHGVLGEAEVYNPRLAERLGVAKAGPKKEYIAWPELVKASYSRTALRGVGVRDCVRVVVERDHRFSYLFSDKPEGWIVRRMSRHRAKLAWRPYDSAPLRRWPGMLLARRLGFEARALALRYVASLTDVASLCETSVRDVLDASPDDQALEPAKEQEAIMHRFAHHLAVAGYSLQGAASYIVGAMGPVLGYYGAVPECQEVLRSLGLAGPSVPGGVPADNETSALDVPLFLPVDVLRDRYWQAVDARRQRLFAANNTVTATGPVPALQGRVCFSDNFTDVHSGWKTKPLPRRNTQWVAEHAPGFSYGHGGLLYVSQPPTTAGRLKGGSVKRLFNCEAPWAQPLAQAGAQATATMTFGTKTDVGFGVTFTRSAGDSSLRYWFLVLSDATWFVQRTIGPLVTSAINPPKVAPQITQVKKGASPAVPGVAPLTVSALCATLADGHSTRLALFVADQPVCDVVDRVEVMPGQGWVTGFVVGDNLAGRYQAVLTEFVVRDAGHPAVASV